MWGHTGMVRPRLEKETKSSCEKILSRVIVSDTVFFLPAVQR
uniref:Uncharacterized protein n=1 Tax=Nelumbo nucifera TaxID=4432 RepID=A0A822YZZ0_NELNU|nr:TPA_asm: hypothetical protein HUJ06_005418 [Nelumbo nucifera]